MPHKRVPERSPGNDPHINEMLLRAFAEQNIDGILLINAEGIVVEWNHVMEQITGVPAQKMLGKKAWDMQMELIPKEQRTPERRERYRHQIEEILKSGVYPGDPTRETGVYREDGRPVFVEQKLFVIKTGSSNWVAAIVRDITDRRTAEEKIQQVNLELQEHLQERDALIKTLESQNEELERFAYTVSHDLKAPLVTIKGFLGYLDQAAAAGNVEQHAQDVQRIKHAVDKMNTLLDELLELSRVGRMMNPSETIPFVELVRDALHLVDGRLSARKVTVDLQPDLPDVYGDRQRLTEVLQNLLDNAVKFMGDQPAPRILIGCEPRENPPVFFVRDNGVGIDPRFHDQVFGLFNKLDVRVEGTGVGLALVKRIVEVHGGRIWIESEVGHGSTFFFTLGEAPGS